MWIQATQLYIQQSWWTTTRLIYGAQERSCRSVCVNIIWNPHTWAPSSFWWWDRNILVFRKQTSFLVKVVPYDDADVRSSAITAIVPSKLTSRVANKITSLHIVMGWYCMKSIRDGVGVLSDNDLCLNSSTCSYQEHGAAGYSNYWSPQVHSGADCCGVAQIVIK